MTIWQHARLNKGGAWLAFLGTFLVISPSREFSSSGGGANMGGDMAAGTPELLPGAGGSPPSSPAGVGGTPAVGGAPDARIVNDSSPRVDAAAAADTALDTALDPAPAPHTAFPAGPYGLKVGETMANHNFTDRDGKSVSLGDLRDRTGASHSLEFGGRMVFGLQG